VINNKKAKHLINEIERLKTIIEHNRKMMDKAKPILECVLPFIERHQEDIEEGNYDFGDLQPALDAMLEFEESEDE